MWPFSNRVQYVNASGTTPAPAANPSDGSSLGGTPTYVTPPTQAGAAGGTSSPAPMGIPPITVGIACPAFSSSGNSVVDGPTVAVLAPAGATRYQVWFSPPIPDPDGDQDAVPIGTDGSSSGPIVNGEVQITPTWARLATYAVAAGSVTATMLVTFQ